MLDERLRARWVDKHYMSLQLGLISRKLRKSSNSQRLAPLLLIRPRASVAGYPCGLTVSLTEQTGCLEFGKLDLMPMEI